MVVAVHVTHTRLERGDGRCRVLLVLRRSRDKGGAPSGWRRGAAVSITPRMSWKGRARARVLRAYLLRRHGARLFAGDVPRATWRGTCARLEVTRVGPFARALRCAARRSFPRRRFGDRTAFEREFRHSRTAPVATCDHVIFDLYRNHDARGRFAARAATWRCPEPRARRSALPCCLLKRGGR